MFGRGGAARKVADARQPRLVPAGEIPQRARPQRARVHLSTVVFVSMSTPVTEVKARIFERLVHTSPYQVAVGFDSLQSSASIQQLRSFVRTHHLGEQPLFVPMSGEASVARHTESIDNFAGGRGQSSGAELAALDWFAGSRFAWMWHLEDDTWSADFGSAASRYANSTADLIIQSGQQLPAWAMAGGWKVGSNAHMRPCGPGLLCYASLAVYRASQRFARALLDEIHQGVASSTNTSHHGLYLPFVISQHPELTWQPLRRSHVVISDDDDARLERFPSLCALQHAELFHPVFSVCGSVEGYTLTNEPCKDCPHPARGVPTQEACRALCDTHQNCDAWVHNTQGECHLKGGSRLQWLRETSSSLRTWSAPRSTRKSSRRSRLVHQGHFSVGAKHEARAATGRQHGLQHVKLQDGRAALQQLKLRKAAQAARKGQHAQRLNQQLSDGRFWRRPWCLLLSATTNVKVDLRNLSYGQLQQRNASERQQMYSQVLAHWLGAYPKLPVALAENSGDSLAWTWTDATKGARLERLRIGPASNCSGEEIGCHEADAILRAVRASRFFRAHGQHEQRLCTHALKVTGRYAVTSDVDAALRGCARGWDLALQNTTWRGGHEVHGTQLLGFRVALAEDLFGWSQLGGMCQECHVHSWLQNNPGARVCHLPPLSVRPVREGSTGMLISTV